MKFLQTLIQEKTGFKVDQPDSSGGTTSTGNVARRAFSDETSFLEYVISTVDIFVRLASQSDPVSVSYRRCIICERCGESGHSSRSKCCRADNSQTSKIDTLFASLTIL